MSARSRLIRPFAPRLYPAGPPHVAGGGFYTGPGDVVGSALGWWGMRAYSAATVGSKCVRVVRASDSAQQDINSLSDGTLDVSSLTSFLTATTGKVVTLYDQTLNGLDVTQATNGNRPDITLSAIGSLAAITFTASSSQKLGPSAGFTPTQSQPWTYSTVVLNSVLGPKCIISNDSAGSPCALDFISNAGSATVQLYAGSAALSAAALATWYAIQGVANGGSSVLYVNGSQSTGLNASTNTFANTQGMIIGDDAFGNFYDGIIAEVGLWGSGFSTGNQSSMNSNQRTYWGF